MNCEKCQDLLSDFLEGTLTGDDHALLGAHIEECLSCVGVRDEVQMLVGVACECREELSAPPNERALWVRIRNTIEIELDASRAVAAATTSPRAIPAPRREGFWSRLFEKRWELSLPQMTAAVFALVVGVSALTAVGVQGWRGGQDGGATPLAGGGNSFDGGSRPARSEYTVAVGAPRHQAYIDQQQVSVNYWKQQVEQRQVSWNPQMRASYERSMSVIDRAVAESLTALESNPHDEVSEEMLHAALRDKMELLREFCDQ